MPSDTLQACASLVSLAQAILVVCPCERAAGQVSDTLTSRTILKNHQNTKNQWKSMKINDFHWFSWFPWLVSIILKYSLRLNNLTLYRKDFKKAELSNASILFCYLFPGGMVALHEKLKRELSNEILIVSNTFALPSCQPTKVIRLKDIYQTPIYVYSWRPKYSFIREKNDDKHYSKYEEKNAIKQR